MTDDSGDFIFPLEKLWIYKVTVLSDLASTKVSRIVQRTAGLNLSQWRVIAAVADRPGRTASEVVDVTPMDKGIVSRAVATLVEKKLVDRRASASDGRLSHLFLTKRGTALHRRIVSSLDEGGASGRDTIAAEREAEFLRILDEAIAAYRR
jgi:DNA-binding MarR family transcriptional regulator